MTQLQGLSINRKRRPLMSEPGAFHVDYVKQTLIITTTFNRPLWGTISYTKTYN